MTKRDEQIQTVLEHMGCVMRRARGKMHFPFNEYELTRPQIHIVMMLHHTSDGLTSTQIAEKLEVTSGAITQFIDGLVQKKLVDRVVDKEDRRVARIFLTDTARQIFQQLKKHYFEAVSPQFTSLDEKELTQLISLLKKTTPSDDETICH